ncbi:hypothetical protein LR48_Vigan11g116300 [Vigna angularis]|uniref:Uncharacterized protein n=1 Tax=Phaseolus angularis TaxID=3914 RepID=A0A0L9VTP0_PHAAN|nr:hypothetical protein LR48_Vigan11g116300 [Vigna angularis]
MAERPYRRSYKSKPYKISKPDRRVYKRKKNRTVILNKKGSDSSSSSSPSAHIHTDDHCNDKDGRTKPDTTGKCRLQAFVHPGDVVTGILSSAATRVSSFIINHFNFLFDQKFIKDTNYRTFNPHSEQGRTLGTRQRGLQFQNRIRPRGLLSDYERNRGQLHTAKRIRTDVTFKVSQLDELTLESSNRTQKELGQILKL